MLIVVLSLFCFCNPLYFTLALLSIVFYLLVISVLNSFLSVLVALILVIVYVGAIIVIIGYICAVSPNFTTVSHVSPPLLFCVFLFTKLLLATQDFSLSPKSFMPQVADIAYSSYGGVLLFLVVTMLFFILLIVTSQYNNPIAPFRSVN